MYEPIRQLIRENRLRKAMHSMGELDLSREHASRLVTLDRRLHIIETKQIGNLSEERLLTIEENGLVQDMLVFLDQVEFPPQEIPAKEASHSGTAPSGSPVSSGAGAGAKQANKQGMGKWIGIVAGLIGLLAVGFFLWPDTDKTPTPTSPRTESTKPPTDALTYEERKKLAEKTREAKRQEEDKQARQEEAAKEKERLKKIIDAKKTTPSTKINPDLQATLPTNSKLLKAKLYPDLMTPGEQVDMALAVYSGQGNVTKADEFLSKSLSSFLSRVVKDKSTSHEVLTATFHNSKERDLMFFGRAQADKRLSDKRARHLVLADVRNVDNTGNAQLRMCIYDTASGETMFRKETANVGTAAQMQEKYILYAVKAFVSEKLGL